MQYNECTMKHNRTPYSNAEVRIACKHYLHFNNLVNEAYLNGFLKRKAYIDARDAIDTWLIAMRAGNIKLTWKCSRTVQAILINPTNYSFN